MQTLMHRFDGSLAFNRGFAEYKEGFGHPSGEVWMGEAALYPCVFRALSLINEFPRLARGAAYRKWSRTARSAG